MKTINRIFLFGDSWIEGQGVYETNVNGRLFEPNFEHNIELLRNWRKENGWSKYIRKYSNTNVINKGIQGIDNYNQFKLLNDTLSIAGDTDLILFGFTSKLRDYDSIHYSFNPKFDTERALLDKDNPLNGMVAWERLSLDYCNFGMNPDTEKSLNFRDEITEKLTIDFIKEYFSSIYDDYPFEYIAQVNYMFYQKYIKVKNLNVIFFDLFEPYVNPTFTKELYSVDKDIYINYGEKTMNQFLIDYEIENIKDNEVSLWECGWKRPDLANKIYHPNQHGIELYVDYLFNNFLLKKYKFESKLT